MIPEPPVDQEQTLDLRLLARLVRLIRPYRWLALLALAIILVAAGLETALPLVTRHAIDVDLAAGDRQGLLRSILLYLGLALGAFGTRYIQQVITGWIGQSIVLDLRDSMFRRLGRLHMAWFDRHPVGRVMTRLTNDVENLNELFTGGLILAFQDVLLLLFIAGVLLAIDWRLALVLFAVLPLVVVASFQFKRLVRAAFRRVRSLVAEVNGFLQENITGMTVVQLFRREGLNRRDFRRINDRLMSEHVRTILYFAVFFPLTELLGALALAAILWFGSGRLLEGVLSFGTLVAFIHYTERFFRPIRDLAEKYNILQGAMASAERVFQLLDEQPAIRGVLPAAAADGMPVSRGTSAAAASRFRGEIEFRNVWLAYEGENWVLKDLSFRVPAGSSAAIVGPTGAGKSSITSLLLRFYEFQRGSILVDGRDIREYDLGALREQMAIVLQDVFLFSGSIGENISLGGDYGGSEIREAARRTGILEHIEAQADGFQAQVGERGQKLSTGQRQLVSFSRALVADPAILILDEATSSVDTLNEELIQRAVGELLRDRTSLVIAHRLSTIQRADRIFVLHNGRMAEEGSHAELMAERGIYYRLWKLEYRGMAGRVES